MDESQLIHGVLRSVLGGRRRRSNRALRYLGGPLGGSMGRTIGGSLLSNPSVLLTAAGVAWGIIETLQGQSATGAPPAPAPGTASAASPLPLPSTGAPVSPSADQALQIVRLAISAAHADGAVSEQERAAIREHARSAGVAHVLEQELAQPLPLAEIVAGVTDSAHRAALYVLAFGILRGDEQPTGAERIYLAKLAHLLGLDPGTVQQLEQNAAQRIDASDPA